MENTGWTWKGVPKVLLNSYYTGGNSAVSDNPSNQPLYTSSDSSFALFGTGAGSSSIEKDTLSYANVTGLDPNIFYQIRFRLASIGINPTLNAAAGVDGSDYVQLEYSSNGGTSWFKEMKIVGAANSVWRFGSGLQVNKTANGSLNTFVGSSASPVSTVGLNLPIGITQLAVNLLIVANATGESWYIDDVELVALTALPVTLVDFKSTCFNNSIKINWKTFSEINNDHFTLYRSDNGFDYYEISQIAGEGNSNTITYYEYKDTKESYGTTYYKLTQTDYDGNISYFGPIVVYCKNKIENQYTKLVNILGQEVDENYVGYKIYILIN